MTLVDSSAWIDYFKGTISAQTERTRAATWPRAHSDRDFDPFAKHFGLRVVV